MRAQGDAPDMSVKEHVLRYDVAQLIYDANWEVKGTLNDRVNDVVEHTMVDEDDVIDSIIKLIREASP